MESAWPEQVFKTRLFGMTHMLQIRKIRGLPMWLPPFQRGQVWSGAQQREFCHSVWINQPLQPLVLWDCREHQTGDERLVVLDGQQRLSAIGAPLLRWNGVAQAPPASFLDLEDGQWKETPMAGLPPLTLLAVADRNVWEEEESKIDPRLWRLWRLADKRVHDVEFPTITLRGGIEIVREVFRRWNINGVPMSEAEVAALLSNASEWSVPAGSVV